MTRWVQNKSGILIPNREAGFIQPGIGLMNKKQGGSGGDPYWSNVVALLNLNGPNGTQTFTDDKGGVWTPSASSVKLTNTQSRFGTTALTLAGNGTLSSSNIYEVSSGTNYTLEFYAYITSSDLSSSIIFCLSYINTYAQMRVGVYGSQYDVLLSSGYQIWGNVSLRACGNVVINMWHHIALVVNSGNILFFVDGVLNRTQSQTLYKYGKTSQIGIQAGVATNPVFNGFLNGIRLTNGIARYTTNFTPPSAPFPNHS